MVQLPQPFDPNSVEPQEALEFEILPAAWYHSRVLGAEAKPAKSGKGSYLEWSFEVAEGPRQGKRFKARMNIVHENQKAQTIALGELSSLCRGVGYTGTLTDTDQLTGQLVDVLLKISPPQGKYGPSNDVKGYASPGEKSRDENNVRKQAADPPQFNPPQQVASAPPAQPPMTAGTAPVQTAAPAVIPPAQSQQAQPMGGAPAQQVPPASPPPSGTIPGWGAPTQQ